MEAPKNTPIYEHTIATFWFDEKGILCSIAKPAIRTAEVMDSYISFIKNLTGGKLVCGLVDGSKATAMDKPIRDKVGIQLKEIYKAVAIISETPTGTMIGSLFLTLEGQPYPTSMFDSEQKAKEWLSQYL